MRIHLLTGANPIYFVDEDSVVSINFRHNPDIKSVHFTNIRVGNRLGVHMADLKWLMHFLSDIGKSCQVEEIMLDVYFLDNTPDWSHWEGVDRILTGTNFGSLQGVDVDISGRQRGRSNPDWYPVSCRGLAASLPLLQARGILGDVV
jgi:hypothetical protein